MGIYSQCQVGFRFLSPAVARRREVVVGIHVVILYMIERSKRRWERERGGKGGREGEGVGGREGGKEGEGKERKKKRGW